MSFVATGKYVVVRHANMDAFIWVAEHGTIESAKLLACQMFERDPSMSRISYKDKVLGDATTISTHGLEKIDGPVLVLVCDDFPSPLRDTTVVPLADDCRMILMNGLNLDSRLKQKDDAHSH